MNNNNDNETLASFIGIAAPETPKGIAVNNFLSNFFNCIDFIKPIPSFENFKDVFVIEETNESKVKELKNSFDNFFKEFAVVHTISKGDKSYCYPLNQNLLTTTNRFNLRYLFYHMIKSDENQKLSDITESLKSYIFDTEFSSTAILSFLCSNLPLNSNLNSPKIPDEDFGSFKNSSDFKNLSKNFCEDLNCLLKSSNFNMLDFYRKYNYLGTLLTSYVVQYMLIRCTNTNKKKADRILLCKGSATVIFDVPDFHSASVKNYIKIRDHFRELLIEHEVIQLKKQQIGNDDELQKNAAKNVDNNRLRRGSSFTKMFSAFTTSGRDMGFIYPQSTAKYKYFALSNELVEFYVRLYLSTRKKDFEFLDNFIEWLSDRYNITVSNTKKLEKFCNVNKIKLDANSFNKNEEYLIENLNQMNCIIKLSDSGYVIVLPEKKGEFRAI